MIPALGVVAVFTLVTLGCALGGSFLDGQIYSLEEAIILPMQIEVTRGHGQILASHPSTGEVFRGTYTGVQDHAVAVGFAGRATATAVAANLAVPATATMIGDRGSVLDCEMLIQAGWRPHGMGRCMDRLRREYRLHF